VRPKQSAPSCKRLNGRLNRLAYYVPTSDTFSGDARRKVGAGCCVGGPGWPLTAEQLSSNAELVRYLAAKYPSIQYLIGHNEYLRFRGTPLWEERDSRYVTGKPDPGERFMAELRARVSELHLRERAN